MTEQDTASVLEQLLEGIDPETGEMLAADHVCAEPTVIRALHTAIQALGDSPYRNRNSRLNAGRPWSAEDDATLTTYYRNAMPLDEMCTRLQRRTRGIVNRLMVLGLLPINQKKHR